MVHALSAKDSRNVKISNLIRMDNQKKKKKLDRPSPSCQRSQTIIDMKARRIMFLPRVLKKILRTVVSKYKPIKQHVSVIKLEYNDNRKR